jgi:hypothetical protein
MDPLQQAGILQRVLDYVGPGHWLFIAQVSSLWRDLYIGVAAMELHVVDFPNNIYSLPQTTLFSSVFASPTRVQLAQAHGLRCTTFEYKRAAGMYADIATLKAARELLMPYSRYAMAGAVRCNTLAVVQFLRAQGCAWGAFVFCLAARRGDMELCAYLHAEHCPWNAIVCDEAASNGHAGTLRWLRKHGCPWQASDITSCAAQSGSVDVLVYLQQQGLLANRALLTKLLNTAGAHNKLAAAKWLRQQGAEWPALLRLHRSWPDDTLAWARSEGCTSPI